MHQSRMAGPGQQEFAGRAGMMSQQGTSPSGMAQQQMGSRGMGQPGMGPRLQSVDIEDVVQTDVVTAEPDTPAPELAEKMAEEDVGAVIVVDRDEPVGVVTDRTVALALRKGDVSERTARDLLSEDLVTGTTTMTVFDALDELSEANVRRLPIVDEDGSLEGIVTLDDILVLLGTELEKAAAIIRNQSPRL